MYKLLVKNFMKSLVLTLFLSYSLSAETLISTKDYNNKYLYPTDYYNIIVKNDTTNGTESYRFENRYDDNCVTFLLKDGKLDKIQKDTKPTDIKSVLEYPHSNIVYPTIENQMYTYVTTNVKVPEKSQIETGEYNDVNCLPTAVYMAYNWCNGFTNKTSDITVNTIRERHPSTSDDGGYSTPDFEPMINAMGLTYKLETKVSKDTIIEALNKGKLIIATCNNSELPQSKFSMSRIGKSYRGGGGHAVLISGYVYYYNCNKDIEEVYLEVVDPAEFTGKNVHYFKISSFLSNMSVRHTGYAIIDKVGKNQYQSLTLDEILDTIKFE